MGSAREPLPRGAVVALGRAGASGTVAKSGNKIMRYMLIGMCVFGAALLQGCVHGTPPESRWAGDIAKFEAQDETAPPPKGATLFVGSSTTRRWDLAAYFPDRVVINRGFGGSQTSDVIEFIHPLVIKHAPKTVVIYEGDNDMNAGKSAWRVYRDVKRVRSMIHAALPECHVYFLPIKPSLKRWALWPEMNAANQRIRRLTERTERFTYVDVATPMLGEDGRPRPELFVEDGLHLSDAGYALWASVLKPALDAE